MSFIDPWNIALCYAVKILFDTVYCLTLKKFAFRCGTVITLLLACQTCEFVTIFKIMEPKILVSFVTLGHLHRKLRVRYIFPFSYGVISNPFDLQKCS